MKGPRLELGGSEHILRYDLNAIAVIGDRLGVTVRLAHFKEDLLETPLPLSALRLILWAGMLHEDDPPTEQAVGALVDTNNLGDVLTVFFSLFSSASPATQDAVRDKLGLDSEMMAS